MISRLIAALMTLALSVATGAQAQQVQRERPGGGGTCCSSTPPVLITNVIIMPFGDSITEGNGSSDGGGYRSRLDPLISLPHTWCGSQRDAAGRAHEGRGGWRIDQYVPIARNLATACRPPAGQRLVIIVDLGTNDAGLGHNEPASQMITEMRQLLAELRAGAPEATLLLGQATLTPYNTDAQRAELNGLDEALPGLATEFGRAYVVDFRSVPIPGPPTGDAIHPRDAGYLVMAQLLDAALASKAAVY